VRSPETARDLAARHNRALLPKSLAPQDVRPARWFLSRAFPPRYLILWAWGIEDEQFRLFGLPHWADSSDDAPYAVEARAAGPTSEGECRLMLQTLLKERFHLVVHKERRQVDGYALEVAKHGPKITPVTDPEAPGNGSNFVMSGAHIQIYDAALQGLTMQQLASALHVAGLGRPVIDRTGLDGIYRIDLRFQMRGTEGAGPDLTTALKEQLGLELTGVKEFIDALVIDRLDRPDPN
jgi:uncharacterized protein (TIGR03435 family)